MKDEIMNSLVPSGFKAKYGDYEVEYMPYEHLQELFDENVATCEWEAEKVVEQVHNKINEYCTYDPVNGLCIDKYTRLIRVKGSQRRLRTLFYFLVTGVHCNGRYALRFPEDNYNTMEIERMTMVDRKELSKQAGEVYRKNLKRRKEVLGMCNE